MNKITKTLIISLIITGFFCFDCSSVYSLDLKFFKKDTSSKTQTVTPAESAETNTQQQTANNAKNNKAKNLLAFKTHKTTTSAENKQKTSSAKTPLKQKLIRIIYCEQIIFKKAACIIPNLFQCIFYLKCIDRFTHLIISGYFFASSSYRANMTSKACVFILLCTASRSVCLKLSIRSNNP